MMARHGSRRYGTKALAFGLAGTAIYTLMINVTLAQIEQVSGHTPFDMRPFGYGPMEAKQLLDALGEEGRRYYLTRQIPLDTIYPALLAVTLISIIRWLGSRLPHSTTPRFGIAFSLGTALFDYLENFGVAAMMLSWQKLPDQLVYVASSASIAKSGLTVAAVSTTIVLGAIWIHHFKEA